MHKDRLLVSYQLLLRSLMVQAWCCIRNRVTGVKRGHFPNSGLEHRQAEFMEEVLDWGLEHRRRRSYYQNGLFHSKPKVYRYQSPEPFRRSKVQCAHLNEPHDHG